MAIARAALANTASQMLKKHGIAFIWDTYLAAAAAHGLGNDALANDLIELAEAAEREWTHRIKLRPLLPGSRTAKTAARSTAAVKFRPRQAGLGDRSAPGRMLSAAWGSGRVDVMLWPNPVKHV